MSSPGGNTVPRVAKAEHIGPDDTGDNIEAKRVAMYGADTTGAWSRMSSTFGKLVPEKYDYIGFNLAGSTTNVYTYKTGGSGGTTVATVTVTYSDSTKGTISSVART